MNNFESIYKNYNKRFLQYFPEASDLRISSDSVQGQKYFKPTLNMDSTTVMVTGCQGTITDSIPEYWGKGPAVQRKIGRRMASTPDTNFRLLLGDNFYRWGVASEVDSKFRSGFESIYSLDGKYTAAVLGNHDYNFQTKKVQYLGASTRSLNRALYQVLYTYQPNSMWFMPYRYYVIELPHANIVVVDSNTLVFDVIQQAWLKGILDTLGKESDKWNIIAQHHPLVSCGKRYPGNGHYDIDQYLMPDLTDYQGVINTSNTMNALLNEFYTKAELKFDLLLCAHDHFLAATTLEHLENKPYQLTIGGGGGKLQNIEHSRIANWSMKSHGYLDLTVFAKELYAEFFDQDGMSLHKISLSKAHLSSSTIFDRGIFSH